MVKLVRTFGLFLLVSAAGACVGPNTSVPAVASKPGWGGVPLAGRTVTNARVVEAALRPASPPTRMGKPGWGR